MRALLSLAAVAGLLFCAAPATAAEIGGEIGLVSDYRFRGIRLSDGQPALQASLSLETEAGPYAGAWASTIRDPGSKTSAELDFYAGYEVALSDGIGIDFTATYYAYPSDWGSSYVETSATLKRTRGMFEMGLGFSFVPPQSGTEDDDGRKRGNRYAFAQAAVTVPGTPVKFTAAAGFERGFFDESAHGGKWDWSAGLELSLSPVRAGVSYVGSDAPGESHSLVASLFFEF